ncbi:MAG TPA: hypothetical protein VD704_12180 [Gaiellaceae bacterium]|jgi:hypothetical protein|nr:hypothetical protein [Gaiellaceae bacterium]
MGVAVIAGVLCVVLVPLVREYAELRRAWGLGPVAATATTLLVLPAVGLGLLVAAPLAAWPLVQWAVTVAIGLGAYSLAVRALEATLAPERAPHSG